MSGSAKARTTRAYAHPRRVPPARKAQKSGELTLGSCVVIALYAFVLTLLMGIGVGVAVTIAKVITRAAFQFAGVM